MTEKFKTALMKNDKNDIKIIIRRTLDAFPEEITTNSSKDMEQLMELIIKFVDLAEDGEAKQRGKAIINKWTKKNTNSHANIINPMKTVSRHK